MLFGKSIRLKIDKFKAPRLKIKFRIRLKYPQMQKKRIVLANAELKRNSISNNEHTKKRGKKTDLVQSH